MTTTLPTPTHGAEYTNSATGDKFKYDSDAGAWEGFEGIDRSGDSMTGTIAYPDMLINGNTLTADDATSGFAVEDGDIDWTAWIAYPSADESGIWYSVAYGAGKFVAVAKSGTNRAMYSEDGVNWTGAPSANDANEWSSVTYGGGKFVAVASKTYYGTDAIMSSEDGINWVNSSDRAESEPDWWSPDYNTYDTIGYGGGKFIIINEAQILHSEDGLHWAQTTNPSTNRKWNSVTYGDGKWVAVSHQGSKRTMYSEDAITWKTVASATERNEWRSVTYGNGKFVSVASKDASSSGSVDKVMHSIEPENGWRYEAASNDNTNWYAVTYGAGYFVAVADRGTNKVMYSPDGETWTSATSGNESNKWRSIAYGNGKFVSVSTSGTNRVMVLDVPYDTDGDGNVDSRLYFNGDPVMIDKGQTKGLARSVSSLSYRLGASSFYTSDEPSDSFGIDKGTLWLNPSNAKLSIYHDSDWNQLN